MYCPTGTYQKSTTTMVLERGDAALVVKHVPAYVCSHRGDAMLSEVVSERLDDVMDAVVAAGGSTVRAYDPETATA